MATSAEPKTAVEIGPVMLCLGCNYSLKGLPDDRCPECGREFDLDDRKSFNSERPLTWLDRLLLKPIGWPTFLTIGVICGWYLWVMRDPTYYYLGAHFFIGLLCLLVVAVLLGGRNILRALIPPRTIVRRSTKLREGMALAAFGITFLLVVLHVPVRVLYLLAKPELDRIAQGIDDGTLTLPLTSHPAGPVKISSSTAYGNDNEYFFRIDGSGGGFAYTRDGTSPGYYNTGTDGRLWGKWHWWVDD
jgi:hypothetical protein